MSFKDILYEVDDGVAQITLNRPDKLNALSWGTLAEIETAMQEANGVKRELSEQIEAEEYHQAITKKSEDAEEGTLSFLEKRPPRFQGK